MPEQIESTHLVVIGGGPGGYAAAFRAADMGMGVTLIEPEENPGGVCLYRGCIPSKTLLHLAKLINESAESANWGVEFERPLIDVKKIREWKESVVAKLTGGLGELVRRRNINHVRGWARFVDASTLEIELVDGATKKLYFGHAIIASGSTPTQIPGFDTTSNRIMDSTDALELNDVPGSLLVIGGGYIGLEMGTAYAAFGSAVTVVEMMPELLPGTDKDLTGVLEKRARERFKDILVNTTVKSAEDTGDGVKVTFESNDSGDQRIETYDKILIAVGRRPNSARLGLENTRVELDAQGFVKVDMQRRTAEPKVYAIGDVTGPPMLAHKASHEGRAAVETIAEVPGAGFDPIVIPAVVYTDPELAYCGLSERQAKEQGIEVKVGKFPWGASGRALTQGRTDGMTKMIADPDSGRLLGVGIVGPGAGELIAEAVLAIELGASATDVELSIHPHPTLSETIMESAEAFFGHSTHVWRPQENS